MENELYGKVKGLENFYFYISVKISLCEQKAIGSKGHRRYDKLFIIRGGVTASTQTLCISPLKNYVRFPKFYGFLITVPKTPSETFFGDCVMVKSTHWFETRAPTPISKVYGSFFGCTLM